MRLALFLAVTWSMLLLAADQPTFRAGVDLVTFGVTVTDRKGAFVDDLTAEDFAVVEDGVPQRVTHFARGVGDGAAPPTHLGLMLDTSASMEADLKLAQTAAIKFLNMLPEAEDITLVDFDTEVRITRYPQRDFARVVERIRQRKPAGWTALYDALGVYLDGASRQDGRTILVMYTDGADSRSRLRFSELLDVLKASQVTVYGVGLVDHAGPRRGEAMLRLQQMADATGGQVFFPSGITDLEAAYAKVLAEIRSQYHLGYVATNSARDGRWRQVDIRIKCESRRDVRVRSRKGYFAPFRE